MRLSDSTAPAPSRVGWGNRLAAIAALVLPPAVLALAVTVAVQSFPRGPIELAGAAIALAAAFYALLRKGMSRAIGFGVAALALGLSVVALVSGDHFVEAILIVAGTALTVVAAGAAFRLHTPLPRVAAAPERPVLFYNPKSGGGKAEKFHLAEEARRRGIEPIELQLGTDLEELVRDAVADGADALAMAGGDGSQAVVAAVAAELGLPYSCVPAGTRNHFALDLGVDRDDVVGALDSLGAGAGERRVDLAEVNGKVFVNNVSLGLYAEAVQQESYRDAKIKTIVDALPEALGPQGEGMGLHWTEPDGEERSSGAAVLVSNNPYRLGRAVGSGTRPRLDQGVLGVTVADAPDEKPRPRSSRPWREWSAAEFVVRAKGLIAAGIDGEAARLEAPLRFRSRPGALRVLIAPGQPGESPSAQIPDGPWRGFHALARIAAGRAPLKD